MYSIKWYQDAHEFYRYTATSADPVQIFDPPTLDVDRSGSWEGRVRIANVTLAAGGSFHCEVSADAPTFHTASDFAEIKVVDPPDGDPLIKGVQTQYLAEDWVDLTCSSGRSKPPPVLSFTINDQPVPLGWLEPQINTLEADGLTSSSLRLRFSLLPQLLQNGSARVACLAVIPEAYEGVSRDVLSTSPRYQASVLEGSAAPGSRADLACVCVASLVSLAVASACPPLL
ncbi:uncharacterized protein [Penaeus vannamei]|uniref:uncharacterized protein n=1 Tax=Penaeus vannamei TaxID=6689 RepID=UPI00387F6022